MVQPTPPHRHPHPHARLQVQIIGLAIFLVAGLLLIAYRNEVNARDLRQTSYAACLARRAQAEDVNKTRAAVGHLILALVPNADPQARANMLRGMVSTETVTTEDCATFQP